MNGKELFRFLISYWYIVLIVFLLILLFLHDIVSKKSKLDSAEKELAQKAESLRRQELALKAKEKALLLQEHKFHNIVNDRVKDRTIDLARDIASREYLLITPAFQSLIEDQSYDRLRTVLSKAMCVSSPFDITARIVSSEEKSYRTSLYECSCPDYQYRRRPCKHMQRLALETGFLMKSNLAIESETSALLQKRNDLLSEIETAHAKNDELLHEIEKARSSLENREAQLLRERKNFQKLLSEKQQSYPWLSRLYADLCKIYDDELISHLRTKARSANKAADGIQKLKQERKDLRIQVKQLEYQLHYYESIFPWLADFKEVPPLDAFEYTTAAEATQDEDLDMLRKHISPEELTRPDRYQLALDRHISRKKSNWEIGIEYERYIGYLCESQGFTVRYNGAITRKEDMGRDLILEKGSKTILVQCKRWAQEKSIHENHVFQLAGSLYEYQYEHPDREVIGVLVTTTDFSPVAIRCADRLDIRLYSNIPFQEYPRIKCNIGKGPNGEIQKIYHLRMDQQYDTVKIDSPGEFYAWSVQESESAGFRRAYRWRASNHE